MLHKHLLTVDLSLNPGHRKQKRQRSANLQHFHQHKVREKSTCGNPSRYYRSINIEVGQCVGSESVFKCIPEVFKELKVRPLCRLVDFHRSTWNTMSVWTSP